MRNLTRWIVRLVVVLRKKEGALCTKTEGDQVFGFMLWRMTAYVFTLWLGCNFCFYHSSLTNLGKDKLQKRRTLEKTNFRKVHQTRFI